MHIPHEMNNKQKAGSRWKTMISAKWILSIMCLLIIFLVGGFANYHTYSASSIAATGVIPIQPIQQSVGSQIKDVEKMARSTDKLAAQPSIWPISGEVTSGFGWRNAPLGEGKELHPGIDIGSNMGMPVVATADGEVVQSGWSEGYGNIVQIDHGNGIVTIYGHNSRIIVNTGEKVKKGQVISYVGSTGKSTGPHVHYEIRVNGNTVDPTSFLVQ